MIRETRKNPTEITAAMSPQKSILHENENEKLQE
jgi:hypothetical protein